MFNNNNNQRTEDGASLIGEGLNVEGDLNCKGSIEVAGIMNGNIIANGLKVLETGSIIGGVKAGRFEVFGFIEGEIYADDIVIGKTATIKGDIFFKDNLKIDEGADVDVVRHRDAARLAVDEEAVAQQQLAELGVERARVRDEAARERDVSG